MDRLANLTQLKRALARSAKDTEQLAALVVGALEELILQRELTIPADTWHEGTEESWRFQAEITVPGLLENAVTHLTLSVDSLPVAAAAGLCPTMEVSPGTLCLCAKRRPTADLCGRLDAVQLPESES